MTRNLISNDGIIFREATQEEIREMEIRYEEEQKKRMDALKKELSNEDKAYLESLISDFTKQNVIFENHFERIKQLEQEYPYRDFGRLTLMETIGYLEDTVNHLKRLTEQK